jgi:hypothetical protein
MNCERCQVELEDFLYGELNAARSAELRAHLAACAGCAARRDDLERETRVFARFYEQTAIEPAGEMWAAIRARLKAESPDRSAAGNGSGWWDRLREGAFGPHLSWLLAPAMLRQAAVAALLVALSAAVTTIYLKPGEQHPPDVVGVQPTPAPSPQQAAPPVPSPATEVAKTDPKNIGDPLPKNAQAVTPRVTRPLTDQELMNQQIARAEREYQKAIRLLDRAIASRRGSLDPALVKQYEASLALIDNSIAASRRAMRERRDDLTGGQFLLAAYAKKVELMQDIAMR